MDKQKRTIFFVSDGTGLTVHAMGRSLLTQFAAVDSESVVLPYVNTLEKAVAARLRIEAAAQRDAARPVIFATLLDPALRRQLADCGALFVDVLGTFLATLADEFREAPAQAAGLSHGIQRDDPGYAARIGAVDFALRHDDGGQGAHYEEAEVILVGVSRVGKTPTCLYLAIQFGIAAANYPLGEEDLARQSLPASLRPHQAKLFGLSIEAARLRQIRQARRPDSRYASLLQCQLEVQQAEALFRRAGVPFVSTTARSIEEIATWIMHERRLGRGY